MTDVLSSAEDRGCGAASIGALRPQLVPNQPVEREASPHGGRRPSTGGFHGREANPATESAARGRGAEALPRERPIERTIERDRSDRIAEIELMRAVANHEPKAEAELVRRIIGLVRARARVLTRSKSDADDAAQSSIVEIRRSAPNYRGEGSLAGWCERITVRTTLRLQRRQARVVAPIDGAVNPDDVGGTTPEPNLSEMIPGGEVERYLLELSDDRHKALILRHVLGHSVDEIAEQTGVSPNTVKDRLRMARKQVRQAIRKCEMIASVKRGHR
jgi:RNA polymerase sigma-70 factor (ECF subfamily)